MRHEQLERHDLRGQGHDPGVVRNEAEQLFALVDSDEAWAAPTGAGHWQVRDVVGHIVDTTEAYFVASTPPAATAEIARGVRPARDGGPGGQEGAPHCAVDRGGARGAAARPTSTRCMGIRGAHRGGLGRPAWCRTTTWDRCRRSSTRPSSSWTTACTPGTSARAPAGRTGSPATSADLLVPFMFVLWSATADVGADAQPCELGVRITGGPERRRHPRHGRARRAWTTSPATSTGVPTVIEFDPGSFVLTAFGRSNAGTDPRRPRRWPTDS